MASFTDIIPQFTPYIQQLPVEAMVQVGMEKQKRYDEGIQKIQSQIDTIAGLELMKPLHKQYLQSKLNELGNDLKMVAAGDFSNFQLVNSVGGMVNQITKDGVIQNALSVTQRIKKGNEELDAARKDGKSSAQNEAWWNKEVNDFLNDGSVTSSFSGQYVPFTDLQKKWMDVQKSLEAEEISRDLPFLQDDQGRFVDAQGKLLPPGSAPVLNDVMIRKIFKGKSPQAIKDAITASMNENDVRQLKIDAWYHYKDTTPNDLRKIAATDQNQYINQLNVQLQNLDTLKQLNPTNAEYQDKIAKEIEKVTEDFNKSMASYNETLQTITDNPQGFKNALYAQKTINDFATKMSNMSEIQQILDNPYHEKLHRDRQYNLAVDNYLETQRHHKATEGLSWQNYLLEVAKFEHTKQKDKPMMPGTLQIPNMKDLEKITLGGFKVDLTNSKNQIDAAKNSFKNTYYKGKEDQFEKDYAFHFNAYQNGTETAAEWTQLFDMVAGSQQAYNDGATLLEQVQAEVDAMPEFKGLKASRTVQQQTEWIEKAKKARELGLYTPEVAALERMEKGQGPRGVPAGPDAALMQKRTQKIEELLQQRIVQTYRPETFSLNTASKQQLDFVRAAFNQYLTRISKSGGQEETGMTKGFSLGTAQALNSSDNTSYGVIRQGNQVYLTMQGKEGGLQVIKTDNGEFSRVFGYSATSPVQQVSDLLFQFGSTNPQAGRGFNIKNNPNAYQTARYAKIRGGSSLDVFPMVSQYNVKADIVQLPAGNYQSVFYIQDPASGNWKTRVSTQSSDLNALRSGFSMLTDASVSLLLK